MPDSTPNAADRLSVWVLGAILLNAALAFAMLTTWVSQARQGLFWQSDFGMFYSGWMMVLRGDGARLYDFDEQLAVQHELLPEGGPERRLLPFNYPLTTAVPLGVLALLTRDVAFYTWATIQGGLLGFLVCQFLSQMSSFTRKSRALMVATLLAFPAVFVSFQMGQLSLLVLVALTGWALALERGWPLSAAAWLVLVTIKPQLAVGPAVVMLFARQWRALAYASAMWLIWAAVATYFVGPSAWLDWLAVVRKSAGEAGQFGIFPDRMYNLKCMLFGMLGAERMPLVSVVSWMLWLAAIAAIAVLWSREHGGVRLRVALSLQLALLTNPHLNPTDAVVYALPALLFALERPTPFMVGFLALCPALFYFDCFGGVAWPFGLRPFLVAMFALAGTLLLSVANRWSSGPGTGDTDPLLAT